MKETEIICDRCGCVILDEESIAVDDDLLCQECHDRYCTSCDHCGRNVYLEDAVSDDYTALCTGCYNEHYTRCDDCNIIIAEADAYELHGYDYCRNCYNERCEDDEGEYIHEYGYKPDPIFYGDGKRFMGVELEIDKGGKSSTNAEQLYDIANHYEERIYIKSDGSLNDGMEIVTHFSSFGYAREDIELLLDFGYSVLEIEEMLMDPMEFRAAVADVRCCLEGEYGDEIGSIYAW